MSHQVPSTAPTTSMAAGARPSSRDPPPSSNTRRASTVAPPKPSFSTLQTHYSPRKNPTSRLPPLPLVPNKVRRPTTTTTTTTTTSSSDDNDPSITQSSPLASQPSQQQLATELARLHLLHSSALPTLHAWRSSARTHFHGWFTGLAASHAELRDIAQQQQGLLNAHALGAWGAGLCGSVVGERVERLSRNGGEVMRMVQEEEEGGKYSRVVAVWEVWFERVERVRERRAHHPGGEKGGGEVEVIEGIGDGWKAEAMVLERELGYCAREFEGFGNVTGGSGLGRLLGAWRGLVRGLLEELDVLQWIEGEVMVEEAGWVEGKIRELGNDLNGGIEL